MGQQTSREANADDAVWLGIRSSDLLNNTFVASRGTSLSTYDEASLCKPMSQEVCFLLCGSSPLSFANPCASLSIAMHSINVYVAMMQELALLRAPDSEVRLAEALSPAGSIGRRGPPCKELIAPPTRSSLVHPHIQQSLFYKLLKLRTRILNRSLESIIALPAPPAPAAKGAYCVCMGVRA